MVVMNEYFRFPLVQIINHQSLDHLSSVFGVPDQVKTDNGPPFNGHKFCRFANTIGFKHRKIPPLWPKGDGEVERFMRTVGKAVKAITANGQQWKTQLPTFLRNYRSTPHPSTGATPAELMFSRKMKIKLPEIAFPLKDDLIRGRDASQKEKMKAYADQRANAEHSLLKVGDRVLVRQPKLSKLSSDDDDDDDDDEMETKQLVPSSTENTTDIAQPGRQQLLADTTQPTTTHRRYPQRNRRPTRFFMDS